MKGSEEKTGKLAFLPNLSLSLHIEIKKPGFITSI